VEQGLEVVRAHTLESETTKVASFIEAVTGKASD
jgi:hypothetical protein